MAGDAADLAIRLAQNAEAVCRHYLPAGRREGNYWRIGDVRNTPGRSMFVRLYGPEAGSGAAGRWTDAATGEHGDLLDVIRENLGSAEFTDVAAEARRFLGTSRGRPVTRCEPKSRASEQSPLSPEELASAAKRLFAASGPIAGTLAETYLRGRGIININQTDALRFHPNCYYRRNNDAASDLASAGDKEPANTWPATVAAVTDLHGTITGVHRTWLDPSGGGKAPVDTPRRSMGQLIGNGVRFGLATDVMAAGEGIETMLSLRSVLVGMPMMAALSATHLGAVMFQEGLRRLYVARDNDAAGDAALATLTERAHAAGIDVLSLSPLLLDFNDDLNLLGADRLGSSLRTQLAPEDVPRFLAASDSAAASR